MVCDWLANRQIPIAEYVAAARGDVEALVSVRHEAGLPVLSTTPA
jgi:hypothetical protein